jgi:hypothetical protein
LKKAYARSASFENVYTRDCLLTLVMYSSTNQAVYFSGMRLCEILNTTGQPNYSMARSAPMAEDRFPHFDTLQTVEDKAEGKEA